MITKAEFKSSLIKKTQNKFINTQGQFFPYKTQNFRTKYQKKQTLILAKKIKDIQLHDHQNEQENQAKSIFYKKQQIQTSKSPNTLTGFRISKIYERSSEKKNLSFNKTFYSNRIQSTKSVQRTPTLLIELNKTTSRIRKISSMNEQSNQNFLAKYEILKQLGKGMYGTVHLAKRKQSKSIKILNKSLLLAIQSEIIQNNQNNNSNYQNLDQQSKQKNQQTENKINIQNLSTICQPAQGSQDQNMKVIDSQYIQDQSDLIAIKVYEKFKMNKDPSKFKNIRKQITVMHNLNHEGIIKLYESVQSLTKICLVVEYGGKQSLLEYLKRNFPLTESKVKQFSRQLLNILIYLHEKNIVHRDIKPQNILIKEMKQGGQQLKLIDFGFSTLTNKTRKLNAICGTPNFMAPELLSSKQYYGQKADVWSYGVVVFVMAEGRHPFKSTQLQELERLVNKGKYTFKRTHSEELQEFITRILKTNSNERPTSQQISKLKWLQSQ